MALTSADVYPGRIFWLPTRAQIPSTSVIHRSAIDEGAFGHPVVILSRPLNAPNTALIQTMTSFNSQNLETRHRHNHEIRRNHLPIKPAPQHPEGFASLELAEGATLTKESYVKTERRYRVEWRFLRPYEDRRHTKQRTHVLTEESLRELIQHNRLYGSYQPGPELPMMTTTTTNNKLPKMKPLRQSPPPPTIPSAWLQSFPARNGNDSPLFISNRKPQHITRGTESSSYRYGCVRWWWLILVLFCAVLIYTIWYR